MKFKLPLLLIFFTLFANAQNNLSGKVTDINGIPLVGVNVKVLGSNTKTTSDFSGTFKIKSITGAALKLEVDYSGFVSQTIEIKETDDKNNIIIKLIEEVNTLNQIVVSASRTEEKKLESPVTIETLSAKQIKNGTAADFYNGLENLKELHINSGSFIQKSVNTRGFATAANPRFMQLTDGMENTSPSLNIVIGNIIGLNELDVANIEVLPGASSALYGANAFNGILFMNSASAFNKPGISAYFKQGFTSQEVGGNHTFNDFGVRLAGKFSDKFAAKANLTYFKGTDWIADDNRNIALTGQELSQNQYYDALNSYGDEISTLLPGLGLVSRTPYKDQNLNDGGVKNVKGDFTLNYRPNGNDFEIILQQKAGLGSTNYSASDARTYLKNFLVYQTKLELKGKNFFFRTYFTGQNAGDSYSMTRAAWNINSAAKSNTEWFTNFAQAFGTAQAVGRTKEKSLELARKFADYNDNSGLPIGGATPVIPVGKARFEPGSQEFNDAFNLSTNSTDTKNGSKFQDNSRFYNHEANYNFRDIVKFAEIQVGGSLRNYILDSHGTVFTDTDSKIDYSEYGIYSQLQKKLLADERLKFTGSVRYDKSKNFNGNFSPRLSVSYAFGKNKQRNLRASFQTGFRNPTTQDQYAGINIGPIALVGSASDNLSRYTETVAVSTQGQTSGQPATINLSGNEAYNNSFTSASVQEFYTSGGDATKLKKANLSLVKPEQVRSYELGYRASILDFSFDINYYQNDYTDLIYSKKVATPYYGVVGTADAVKAIGNRDVRTYQVYTNAPVDVKSRGVGFGLNREFRNFDFGFSYNYAEQKYDKTIDPDFQPAFNTPKQKIKFSIGNDKLFKNIGFNTNFRWNNAYEWQSSFATGTIPSATVIDAQVNFTLPILKSNIKIGANNLFGKDYLQVLGAGLIGKQYFVSLTYNP